MTNYEKLFGTLEKATATLTKRMNCIQCPLSVKCKVHNPQEEWDICYEQIESYLIGEAEE